MLENGEDHSFGAKATQERTRQQLQEIVSSHSIVLFMKVRCVGQQSPCDEEGGDTEARQLHALRYRTVAFPSTLSPSKLRHSS